MYKCVLLGEGSFQDFSQRVRNLIRNVYYNFNNCIINSQTLMLDSNYKHKFKNTPHAFSSLRIYGLKEYYRGLVIHFLFFLGWEWISVTKLLLNQLIVFMGTNSRSMLLEIPVLKTDIKYYCMEFWFNIIILKSRSLWEAYTNK